MLINDNDNDYRDADVDSKLNISLYVYKKREECERNREGKKTLMGRPYLQQLKWQGFKVEK